MNDIERVIEEDFEEEKEESANIKPKLNRSNNDDKKKKIIIYVILGVICFALIGTIVYLIVGNKSKESVKEEDKENKEEEKTTTNKEENNFAYVSCDDNTTSLNVRSSPSGDIIDGLSCFKKVTIDEEVAGEDNCKTWYKVHYKKKDNNYTGYVCASYIKKNKISEESIKLVNDLFEKANDYYEYDKLMPYCKKDGNTTKEIEFIDNGITMKGEYIKSEYKTIEELKEYLLSFMDESLIETKLELSDLNNKRYYDNYYEIDGNLYCRNYSGKGYRSLYTKNYDIEVTEEKDNKITAKVAYEYLTEDSDCDVNNLSSCTDRSFEYKIGNIVVEKKNNNYIVTKFDFHN